MKTHSARWHHDDQTSILLARGVADSRREAQRAVRKALREGVPG